MNDWGNRLFFLNYFSSRLNNLIFSMKCFFVLTTFLFFLSKLIFIMMVLKQNYLSKQSLGTLTKVFGPGFSQTTSSAKLSRKICTVLSQKTKNLCLEGKLVSGTHGKIK